MRKINLREEAIAMLKLRLAAGIGVLTAVAIAAPAAASPTTSSVNLFQNPARTADCGIEVHPGHSAATEVLCSGAGVPRPKHGEPAGDPFVQIGSGGQPKLVLISQDSFVGSTIHTLAKGTLWHSIGVTCNIGTNTILCFNGDNHGFVIGNGKYKSF
jgi:hypothetical protein